MVIDTSAILAILLGEPKARSFASAIANDPRRLVSSVSTLEAAIVIHSRKGRDGVQALDELFRSAALTVVSFSPEQALLARQAYQKLGKGHHPAGLNLGDCCSYALAQSSEEPLLFKGRDFARTDVLVVKASAADV